MGCKPSTEHRKRLQASAGTLQFMTGVVAASRGKELAKEDLKTAEEGGEGEMGESSDGHRKPGS